MEKTKTYNQAIAEIEAIVKKLESSELNVDELSNDVKRSLELIEFCKSKLRATKEQINKVIDEN